jgi:hypothetical protein
VRSGTQPSFCLLDIIPGTVMEALSQTWVAILSMFTPIVLFVFMNVVIGTIAVTSGMC